MLLSLKTKGGVHLVNVEHLTCSWLQGWDSWGTQENIHLLNLIISRKTSPVWVTIGNNVDHIRS